MTHKPRTARRTRLFTESVIREMTRVAQECGALNLAQGFPDFPAPQVIKDAACQAIQEDINQYAITWGSPRYRDALVRKYRDWYGMEVNGEREITVTCGATEAMASIMMAVINPGDEVIVLEPFYENYGPDAILCEATPVFHRLEPPEFRLDAARLEADVTPRTRAIILNTPNNPTGRVFDREELEGVADICRRHDILAFTDEIYEHIHYEGEHIPLATLPDMRERTVTVSGASKTYSVTGWRLGTIVAPADLTDEIRKVHDFLTVGAPAPLQEGVAAAMNALGPEFYDELKQSYLAKREILHQGLQEGGFRCSPPQGAYYIMADFSDLSDEDDDTFSRSLASDAGVIPVPGSSFFNVKAGDSAYVRFVFCKRIASLETASERLRAYARAGS